MRPTPDGMRLAAEWLDEYEGEEHENGELAAVAEFLRTEASRRERAAIVRKAVRDIGVTPAIARAAIAKAEGR